MKPVIGLTVHADRGAAGDLYPGHPLFYVERHYADTLQHHGMYPILIPVVQDGDFIQYLVGKLDGLVLTGGGFLRLQPTPQPLPGLKGTGSVRYAFERALLQAMIPKGAPILGICRGAQMINDVSGGTCINLDGKTTIEHHQGRKGISGDQVTHAVRLSPSSRIATWIGRQRIEVNSFHRQAVSTLGKGLKAAGWSEEDGVIEVFEGVDHPWLIGVQFHPEQLWRAYAYWTKFFTQLRQAAIQYRRSQSQ